MDRKQLKQELSNFIAKCAENGRALTVVNIEDAYPGDASTSFIVHVTASWIDEMFRSDAIDFLFDVLWETTTEELRRKIFTIMVHGSNDQLRRSSAA